MIRRLYQYNDAAYQRDVNIRTKKVEEWFNLRFSPDKIPSLIMARLLSGPDGDHILKCYEALEDIYPGMGDIQLKISPRFEDAYNTYGRISYYSYKTFSGFFIENVYLIVRFPELTITNSKGNFIPIKDLYIRVGMDITGRTKIESIDGTRTTVSAAEYHKRYAHSHLHSVDYSSESSRCKFDNFCLGSGQEMSMIMSLFNNNYRDYDSLRLLLLHLKTYASWESLEGTPHIEMANVVGTFNMPNIEDSTCTVIHDSLIDSLTYRKGSDRLFKLDINWRFLNGKYYIIDDEKFETTLRDLLYNYAPGQFMSRDEAGNYFLTKDVVKTNDLVGKQPNQYLIFRGQKQYFKVEETTFIREIREPKYLHPKAKLYVKDKLEHKANYENLRKTAFEYANSSADT